MKKIFIKASGDVLDLKGFHDFVVEKSNEGDVVICVGGGKQINQMFEEKGYPVLYHELYGRITESDEQRQYARDILDNLKKQAEEDFKDHSITVISPLINVGNVLCDVNADLMIEVAYIAFDYIYLLTLDSRVERKTDQFKDFEKVSVVGF